MSASSDFAIARISSAAKLETPVWTSPLALTPESLRARVVWSTSSLASSSDVPVTSKAAAEPLTRFSSVPVVRGMI
jgi:hypothetical protein